MIVERDYEKGRKESVIMEELSTNSERGSKEPVVTEGLTANNGFIWKWLARVGKSK